MLRISKLSLSCLLNVMSIFHLCNCNKRPMVWIIHPEARNMFNILTKSQEMQRRSSIERLTSAEKVELCRSEIFLFISNKHHPTTQSLSGSDEEEEKDEKEGLPLPKLESVPTSESEEEYDFCSADAKSLPSSESEEETESDSSSLPALLMSNEEEDDEEEEISETESLSESRTTISELPLERTSILWNTAKKLYPFNQSYDHFYASVIFNVIQFVVVSVETESLRNYQYFVKSLPCYLEESWSWFLVNGYVKDMYFTIQKGNVNEKFTLNGLLDTVPQADNLKTEELEETYLKGQTVVVSTGARKSLCKLDDFTKFRLCSAAYIAMGLTYSISELSQWNFIVEEMEKECRRDVLLHFTSADEKDERAKIPTHLLSCFVNGDLHGPQFYLTADAVYRDAVYVVFRAPVENIGPRYILEARLTNITALRMIRVLALMEKYNPRFEEDELFHALRRKKKEEERKSKKESMLNRLMSSVSFSSQSGTGEGKPMLSKLLSSVSFSSQSGIGGDEPALRRLLNTISMSRRPRNDEDQTLLKKFLNSISFSTQAGDGEEKPMLRKLMNSISFTSQTSSAGDKPSLRKLLSGISFKKVAPTS